MSNPKLLIVGNLGPSHIGAMFLTAAQQLGIEQRIYDSRKATEGSWLIKRIHWHLLGHRPPKLEAFSKDILDVTNSFSPDILLVTGITPPNASVLQQIRTRGVQCVNYLTDDPWNASHTSTWFMETLQQYDIVFTPRRSNFQQLAQVCQQVQYLPFGYDPNLHYPVVLDPIEQQQYACDATFYGGGDADRIPFMRALVQAGINLHLYGGYWDRYSETASANRGIADLETIRKAVVGTKINICLVRRGNRDGHVMRSFEIPAMGGFMLTEDTQEHREIFGDDGDKVIYFSTPEQLVDQVKKILDNESLRRDIAQRAYLHITSQPHTYKDRLENIINNTL